MRILIKFSFFCFLISFVPIWADSIRVTTWNIECLGISSRGYASGYGQKRLPRRTDNQLKSIGLFIRDTLKADLVALQEIGITDEISNVSRSTPLDKITAMMGDDWKYHLPNKKQTHQTKSMYLGYLWNSQRIRAIKISSLELFDLKMEGKSLFNRKPLIGYFEILKNGKAKNDFLLVNVHLASGQDNDENHLIAMTLIEYYLNSTLKKLNIKESDRIILGDFNDNPYAKRKSGRRKYSDALYRHMQFKKYANFVTKDFSSTRMSQNLDSIIDHMLINSSAKRHVVQKRKAKIWLPSNGPKSFSNWRETYSDHFPISIDIKIGKDDDRD